MDNPKQEKKVVRYHLVRHKWPDEIEAERKRKHRRICTIAACVFCFTIGFLVNSLFFKTTVQSNRFSKLEEIYNVMNHNWYFGKDVENLSDVLVDNAIEGVVSNELDPHTMYMSADQTKSFSSSLEGNFVGIGIEYYAIDGTAIVNRVFKDGGAEKGGVLRGDIIKRVDGVDCEGLTLDEISSKIKGEAGTSVNVDVLRENKEISLTIERAIVNSSVYGYVQDGTGIIEISSFAESSGKEVGRYLEDFNKQGITSILIDLRDNTGGYVTAAMQIGSYFLKDGDLIYKEQNKKGTIVEKPVLDDYPTYTYDHIILLVNGETASASEVLTSCLKEQLDNVQVVGEKTYGKGTVQTPIAFEDGSSFKYTVAEWLTPNGVHIHNVGIEPDYEVSLDGAMTTGIPPMEDDETVVQDQTSIYAKPVQLYLKFLGYPVDRTDEYFSIASSNALRQYQNEHNLNANGEINIESIRSLLSSCSLKWHQEEAQLDLQKQKAMELIKK